MSNIKDLRFDDKNFNKHTEYGMSLLEKSLRENGAGRSILIDKDNNIIAGNGIVEAAGSVGLEKVKIVETSGDEIIAVKRTDIALDSERGRTMALADNATASIDLDWNDELISEEADKWGFDASDWLGNNWKDESEEVVEDEAPEVDESEPPKSKLGGVYQLGRHRLMCGDSTDAGSVAILMDGQKADMVFTDPPYNANYKSRGKDETLRKGIKNDNMPDEQFDSFIEKFMLQITNNIKKGGCMYICCNWKDSYPRMYFECLKQGVNVSNCIVWDKKSAGMGWQDYRYQYEFIIYGFDTNEGHEFYGDRKQTDIWECSREVRQNYVHPTQKPIEIPAKAIQNSSEDGESVLDLFGGSGSTLIACEQLGRKCYMMELDPKYCDVIRKRYWKFTHNGEEEGWQEGTKAL